MQVFTFSLISILWVIYGYSVAFTEGGNFFGTLDKLFLKGVTVDSVAATSRRGVVVSECLRDLPGRLRGDHLRPHRRRLRRAREVLGRAGVHGDLVHPLSYLPMAHMVWYWAGPGCLHRCGRRLRANSRARRLASLFQKGALDFAGGTVVHINAAVAGLVGPS